MPSISRTFTLSTAVILLAGSASAFVPAHLPPQTQHQRYTTICAASSQQQLSKEISDLSRRQVFRAPAFLAVSSLLLPELAFAKDTVEEDKAKIVKGYERLTYLLDNWDTLTIKCSGVEKDPFSGKPVCEKNPLVVQEYIGYKSMNDPLFKADKTLRRLEDLVPASRDTDYFNAIEQWSQAVEEASGMAYTSSWAGPQNPNGGDDSIAYYLERSQKQVKDAQGALRTVMEILDLKK